MAAKGIDYASKRIIVADLDGTLAPSKAPCDSEMAQLILGILGTREFAVIGGGSYSQFEKQFVGSLQGSPELLKHLYLFPTCASSAYVYQNGKWEKLYSEDLSQDEKKKITAAIKEAMQKFKLAPEKVYGEQIEDRGTQITLSALGQQAPLELKSKWDPDAAKRKEMKAHLDKIIPEFEVRIGGTTSIDVTRKGIDKAYGIRKISERLGYKIPEMLFIGDAIYEGGNDYAVVNAGVEYVPIKGPEDTKRLFSQMLKTKPSANTKT